MEFSAIAIALITGKLAIAPVAAFAGEIFWQGAARAP
jgi:hypothetical protein